MINHNSLCIRGFRVGRSVVWLAPGLLLVLAAARFLVHTSAASSAGRPSLTFEERVAAQRAIEEVYWRHRLWPKENPQPKPSLDQVLPEAAVRAKVEDYLRKSQALEVFWQRPITAEQLQAEMERQARQTKQPDALRELWAALGNDPSLIAECLARPALAERLSRECFAAEQRARKDMAAPFDEWWDSVKTEMASDVATAGSEYWLPEMTAAPGSNLANTWTATSTTGAPTSRTDQMAVWTGNEMIIWSGRPDPFLRYNDGGRYNPATDTWTATSTTSAPSGRAGFTAVWTGSEMIVWGGSLDQNNTAATGGRYNPMTNTWVATNTTGAPSARRDHTVVWTGSEMIIWGGSLRSFETTPTTDTGGRYNPGANTWTATNMTGAPAARVNHTAVWTGSEMIVWGGFFNLTTRTATGGRYNPSTNAWTATSTTSAPAARADQTAVWTGSEMIVWGGAFDFSGATATGGRYRPSTNTWTATSATGAPVERQYHTAVWTGSQMIVWGGFRCTATGGLYNPLTDTWTATSAANAPRCRDNHSAVWTGNMMIVWGGQDFSTIFNTGGIYLPSAVAPLASVSAASFTGDALAPESIAAAFGQGLATATETATSLPLPATLAGTSVMVRDSAGAFRETAGVERPASLFFVSPGQINFQIPPGTANGAATVTVVRNNSAVASGTVQIAAVAPGLFSANANGQGVAAAVVFRRRADGSESFEPVARFDQAQSRFVAVPIDLGPETDQVFLILYGSGFRFRSSLSATAVTIGGVNSEVLFAGDAPGFVGLDQANVRLSRSLIGRGEVDVVLTAEMKTANTARIAVR